MTIRSGSPGFLVGQSSTYTVTSSWGTFDSVPGTSGRWTIHLSVNSTGIVDFRALGSVLSESSQFNTVTTSITGATSGVMVQSATKVWHTIRLQAKQGAGTTGAKTIKSRWIVNG